MKILLVISLLVFLIPFVARAGAQKEAASVERAKYLAEEGIIILPEEVYIDSYISYIDYHYPIPDSEVGVTLYSGYRQISSKGQEEIVQIGIQGGETRFEELPPMNLAFIIDKSSSMRAQNKMNWVQESFDIFIERVRDKDFVSLIFFDDRAKVLFPPTLMNSESKRERLKRKVDNIRPCGGSNLATALNFGYQQVLSNYRDDYVNRVILLTDGIGKVEGILDMAKKYSEMGIHISTIGFGTQFDLKLMRDLANAGGGSTRFISGKEEMEETFRDEFDRMVAPVARDLNMKLEFLQEVEILDTWGYDNRIEGNTIHYFLPTLHNRDYETILVQIRIPPGESTGERKLALFSLTYTDLKGNKHHSGPYYLESEFVDIESPVAGFTDGKVLLSGTMLHFAQNLKKIGELYKSCQVEKEAITQIIMEIYWGRGVFEEWLLNSPKVRELEKDYLRKIRAALNLSINTQRELKNAAIRLDSEGFDDEIAILDKYNVILGGIMEYVGAETIRADMEEEIAPPVEERSLNEHLKNLFHEMTLDMGTRGAGTIAISGFTSRDEKSKDLVTFLNQMALMEVTKYKTLQVVERDKLDMVLEEQKLSLDDLMDTSNAVTVGKILTANHILTGSVIEMSSSVIIFGRIINVETGEIESVAQVIVPNDKVQEALL